MLDSLYVGAPSRADAGRPGVYAAMASSVARARGPPDGGPGGALGAEPDGGPGLGGDDVGETGADVAGLENSGVDDDGVGGGVDDDGVGGGVDDDGLGEGGLGDGVMPAR